MSSSLERTVAAGAQVFGLLDMQEQVEAALGNMARTLESTSASSILADFTQLAAMIRQEVCAPALLALRLSLFPQTVRTIGNIGKSMGDQGKNIGDRGEENGNIGRNIGDQREEHI